MEVNNYEEEQLWLLADGQRCCWQPHDLRRSQAAQRVPVQEAHYPLSKYSARSLEDVSHEKDEQAYESGPAECRRGRQPEPGRGKDALPLPERLQVQLTP